MTRSTFLSTLHLLRQSLGDKKFPFSSLGVSGQDDFLSFGAMGRAGSKLLTRGWQYFALLTRGWAVLLSMLPFIQSWLLGMEMDAFITMEPITQFTFLSALPMAQYLGLLLMFFVVLVGTCGVYRAFVWGLKHFFTHRRYNGTLFIREMRQTFFSVSRALLIKMLFLSFLSVALIIPALRYGVKWIFSSFVALLAPHASARPRQISSELVNTHRWATFLSRIGLVILALIIFALGLFGLSFALNIFNNSTDTVTFIFSLLFWVSTISVWAWVMASLFILFAYRVKIGNNR